MAVASNTGASRQALPKSRFGVRHLLCALLVVACARGARADPPSRRPYSPPLVTTGTIIAGVGTASILTGMVWSIVVLTGPNAPEKPCTLPPGQWFCLDLHIFGPPIAWDEGPGLAMIAVGAGAFLLGAALVHVGVQPAGPIQARFTPY